MAGAGHERGHLEEVETSSSPSTTSHKEEAEERGPPRACVFVANFRGENEPELRELLERHGSILRMKVLRDSQSPRTYAFVQYRLPADADRAIQQTHGLTLNGRVLRVELAKVQRTLFLAKLPQTMDEEQLRALVQEYGPLEKLSIITNHLTQKSRCCGFVKFAYREDAVVAFDALRNSQRRWIVEWSISSHDPDPAPVAEKPDTVFIGNLPHSANKEAVEARFSQYGTIEHVTFVDRSTPRSSADEHDASTNSSTNGHDSPSTASPSSDSSSSASTTSSSASALSPTSSPSSSSSPTQQQPSSGDQSASASPASTESASASAEHNEQQTDAHLNNGSTTQSPPGRSFAFVRFSEHSAAAAALEQNGAVWEDCQLRCEPAEAKSKRNRTGQRGSGSASDRASGGLYGNSYHGAHPPTVLHRQIYPRGDRRLRPQEYDPAAALGYRDAHLYYQAIPDLTSAFDPRTPSYHASAADLSIRRAGGIGAAVGFRADGHRHQHRNGPLGPYVHPGYAAPGAGRYAHSQPPPHQTRRGGAAPAFTPAYAPHHTQMTPQLYPSPSHTHPSGPAKRREFALEAGPEQRIAPSSPVSRQSPPTFGHTHFQPMGAEYDSSAQWASSAAYPARAAVRHRPYGHQSPTDSERIEHTRTEDPSRW